MKWYKRAEFEKTLRKLEKDLKQKRLDVSYFSDYEVQKYFQKLKRIQKQK